MVATAQALIVDDDAEIRHTLRFTLEDAGYAVQEAATVAEAEAILRASQTPQVVLLDQIMPQVQGIELLRQAAREPEWGRQHTYILVTAIAHVAALEAEIANLPMPVPLLRKPFDLDDLLGLVADAAQRAQP